METTITINGVFKKPNKKKYSVMRIILFLSLNKVVLLFCGTEFSIIISSTEPIKIKISLNVITITIK